MQKILITGGAGYIGSHAVLASLEKGYQVVVVDSLFRGYKQVIEVLQGKYGQDKLSFYQVDLTDRQALEEVFAKEKPEAVMHFGALCLVNESTQNPDLYFNNNVVGSINLVSVMDKYNVSQIVFSSTSEVYGENKYLPMDEEHSLIPTNPYGLSKKMIEDVITQYAKWKSLKYVIFRYFNVTGAPDDGFIGDSKKPSVLLVQNAVRGALGIETFKLTCPTVETRDGTPVRDYVNVMDLIDAHILALDYMNKGGNGGVFNLGTEKGYSVKEIINQVQDLTGVKFEVGKGEIRQGEPAEKYAKADKAKKILGWKPKRGIKESVESLVKWYKTYPNGWQY